MAFLWLEAGRLGTGVRGNADWFTRRRSLGLK